MLMKSMSTYFPSTSSELTSKIRLLSFRNSFSNKILLRILPNKWSAHFQKNETLILFSALIYVSLSLTLLPST